MILYEVPRLGLLLVQGRCIREGRRKDKPRIILEILGYADIGVWVCCIFYISKFNEGVPSVWISKPSVSFSCSIQRFETCRGIIGEDSKLLVTGVGCILRANRA